MIDERERYERAFGLFEMPEPAFERLTSRRARKQRNRRIAAGAVGLVVAALVIGGWVAAVVFSRTVPANPDRTPTPDAREVEIPRALPYEPGEWSIETSLGTWTWTRIDGDAGTLPGWVSFFADGRYWAFDRGLWASEDGITWTREPLPEVFRGREVYAKQAGESVWAIDTDGSLYRREDDATWVEVDLPTPAMPSVTGMEWSTSGPTDLITDGTTTLALLRVEGEIDWSSVSEAAELHASATSEGYLRLYEYGGPEVARLDMEMLPGDPGAVEFRRRDTGELVLRIEVTDPAVPLEDINGLDDLLGRAGVYLPTLLVDDGSGFRTVEPPWSGVPIDALDIARGEPGFVAVGVDAPEWFEPDTESRVFAWGSTDGVTWQRLEDPHVGSDALWIELAGEGRRLVMAVVGPHVVLWTSADGSTWEPAADLGELGEVDFGDGVGTNGSFFTALYGRESFPHYVVPVVLSADGSTWETVNRAPGLEEEGCDRGVYSGSWLVGERVFVSNGCFGGAGPRVLWVGHLTEG